MSEVGKAIVKSCRTPFEQVVPDRDPLAVDLDASSRHDVGDLILAAEREPEAVGPLAGRAPEDLLLQVDVGNAVRLLLGGRRSCKGENGDGDEQQRNTTRHGDLQGQTDAGSMTVIENFLKSPALKVRIRVIL